METPNQTILPVAPAAPQTSVFNIKSILNDKKNMMILGVVVIGCIFFAYKMKYLDFLIMNWK